MRTAPSPLEFSFEAMLERESGDMEVHVVCRAENYARSVGLDEPCRYREVTVIRTEYRGAPLTDEEMDYLQSKAVDQLAFH